MTLSLFSLLSVFLLSACGDLVFSAINAPTHVGDVVVTKDVSFGPRADEKLDIYAPKTGANNPLPVIVFYYGGRWTFGDRAQYRFAGVRLARQGYVVVIPDYRKYPDVKFPAFVDDGAAALAWTADNIARYNGDPAQINLTGHSSGAHIASLVAADPRYLAKFDKNRSIIRSVVGIAGPYAFIPDEPDLIDMFGPPENYPNMQASTFIDGKQPPMLLLTGADDTTVYMINVDRMQTAAKQYGGCIKTKSYPGADHMGIMRDLTWLGSKSAPIVTDMIKFFEKPCA